MHVKAILYSLYSIQGIRCFILMYNPFNQLLEKNFRSFIVFVQFTQFYQTHYYISVTCERIVDILKRSHVHTHRHDKIYRLLGYCARRKKKTQFHRILFFFISRSFQTRHVKKIRCRSLCVFGHVFLRAYGVLFLFFLYIFFFS